MENVKYFFSRIETAGMLGVSYVTIDRLVKAGKLPCKHLGRRVLFTLPDIQAFAASVGTGAEAHV